MAGSPVHPVSRLNGSELLQILQQCQKPNFKEDRKGSDSLLTLDSPVNPCIFGMLSRMHMWTVLRAGLDGLKITVAQHVHDKTLIRSPIPAETTPSWLVACILIASVFVVFLVLLGCFVLLWYVYKKTKYIFSPRNSLPQHLKEVGKLEQDVVWKTPVGRCCPVPAG